jgi:2'-5' RNA ligase
MTETNSYSIWLIPSGDIYDSLSRIISSFSVRYQTPLFIPHITLIDSLTGSIDDVSQKIFQLVSLIHPFEIRLERLDHLEEYFKCLFIRVEKTTQIMQAYLRAITIFNIKTDFEYMPHLSLLYGKLKREEKDHIIKSLRVEEYKINFSVNNIAIVQITGHPESWRPAKYFDILNSLNNKA